MIAAVHGTQTLMLGGVGVTVLPRVAGVELDDIHGLIDPSEWARAFACKSSARRDEILRSRYLLRSLTGCRTPLPLGAGGEPTWPEGWLGSLSHKDGHVALALHPVAAGFASVGLDLESIARVKPNLESRILGASESARLDAWDGDRQTMLAAAFAFKEAIFKAHFPLGRTMFWMHDAEIEQLNMATGAVVARLLVDSSKVTPRGTLIEGALRLLTLGADEYVLAVVTCVSTEGIRP